MKRLILIAIFALPVVGCADTSSMKKELEELRLNHEKLQAEYENYVKSDARSTALTKSAIEDIEKAFASLTAYIRKNR